MYDWIDERMQLHNGFWIIDKDDQRLSNGRVLQTIHLASQYVYIF